MSSIYLHPSLSESERELPLNFLNSLSGSSNSGGGIKAHREAVLYDHKGALNEVA